MASTIFPHEVCLKVFNMFASKNPESLIIRFRAKSGGIMKLDSTLAHSIS